MNNPKPPLLLVGVGGAGAALARNAHRHLGGRLALVNAAEDLPQATPAIDMIPLAVRPRGARTAASVTDCAERAHDRLVQTMAGTTQVLIFAGMGGAVGSGAAVQVARSALGCGCDVAAFATMPFAVEARALPVAERAIRALRAQCPEIQVHDHAVASHAPASAGAGMEALLALASDAALAFSRARIEACGIGECVSEAVV